MSETETCPDCGHAWIWHPDCSAESGLCACPRRPPVSVPEVTPAERDAWYEQRNAESGGRESTTLGCIRVARRARAELGADVHPCVGPVRGAAVSGPSPVELIAEALRQHGWGVQIGYYQSQRLAEAVEAAVRSWPAVTQAQLIGGGVSVAGSDYTIQCSGPAETLTAPGVRFGSAERVVGPWVPVPAQLIGDTE